MEGLGGTGSEECGSVLHLASAHSSQPVCVTDKPSSHLSSVGSEEYLKVAVTITPI